MKRFVIGIGVSIVMISMGCAMMLFELKDYRVVNSFVDFEDEVEEYSTEVSNKDPLRIELDDDFHSSSIRYVMDETMEYNVKIEVRQSLDHRFSNNRLRIDERRWRNVPIGKFMETFVDGLKDKKLYYYDDDINYDEDVTIYCSTKAQEFIETRTR